MPESRLTAGTLAAADTRVGSTRRGYARPGAAYFIAMMPTQRFSGSSTPSDVG